MEHRVIAHSGCSYSEIPVEFFVGEERHRVSRIIISWLEETRGMEGMTRQVWRVLDTRGRGYNLTHYRVSDFWEIEEQNDAGSGRPR
jgi:hypothetical protein